MKAKLHHCAFKITKGNLPKVIEIFGLLDCEVVFRPEINTWVMISQNGINLNLQLVEYDEKPISEAEIKQGCHIALISDNPKQVVENIKDWADKNNFEFRDGGWNEKELFFDLPQIFINFVVEVMHVSVVE